MRAIVLAILLLSSSISSAQPLKPVRVTIFKPGFAHVIKQGTLHFHNNVAILEGREQPLLGTYWLNGNKGTSMQFGIDTVKVTRDVTDFFGLLSANRGSQVTMTYAYQRTPDKFYEASGELLEFFAATRMLKLRRGDGKPEFVSLAQADILRLTLSGNEKPTYTADSIYRVAKVFSESNKSEQDAELHYVGTGFTWIPSYYVRVLNDKEVRMEMKALVENFAEPLNDVETDLVIGTPNLAFGMQLDPILSGAFDQAFDAAVRNDLSINGGRSYSNSIRVNSTDSYGAVLSNGAFQQNYMTVGEKSFDLFHYQLGKITLPVSTKAYFPIFAEKVPYTEVYHASIHDVTNFQGTLVVRKEQHPIDVFHSFKLTNTTSYPFTTASVVVEDKASRFLAQERLIYTPMKATVNIPISKAIDVIVKNSEEEVSRDLEHTRINDYMYTRARIKGKITVRNHQSKAIQLDLTKSVNGEVTRTENNGKPEVQTNQNINPSTVITWQVSLAPDETKTVEYEYGVLFNPRR